MKKNIISSATPSTHYSHHHKPGKQAFYILLCIRFDNFHFFFQQIQILLCLSSKLWPSRLTSLLLFCSRLASVRPCTSGSCDPKSDKSSATASPMLCKRNISFIFWDILLQNISYKVLHIKLHFNLSSQLNRMSFRDYEVSSITEYKCKET